MKRPRTLLALVLGFFASLLSSGPIYSYWADEAGDLPGSQGEEAIVIGQWYYVDEEDPDAPPLIFFDVTDPPKDAIGKNSIVVVVDEDGNTYAFKALKNVNPNDPDFNPLEPNTSWARLMTYSESTRDYRHFHHYHLNDLVIFNGKTYKWTSVVAHNPNTITQVDPEESIAQNRGLWEVFSDQPEPNRWYRHLIYNEGEEVIHRERRGLRNVDVLYVATQGGHSGQKPSSTSSVWRELGTMEVSRRLARPDTSKYEDLLGKRVRLKIFEDPTSYEGTLSEIRPDPWGMDPTIILVSDGGQDLAFKLGEIKSIEEAPKAPKEDYPEYQDLLGKRVSIKIFEEETSYQGILTEIRPGSKEGSPLLILIDGEEEELAFSLEEIESIEEAPYPLQEEKEDGPGPLGLEKDPGELAQEDQPEQLPDQDPDQRTGPGKPGLEEEGEEEEAPSKEPGPEVSEENQE